MFYIARIIKLLYVNRQLLWQFTLRNVYMEHKGSYLGLIWTIINPILTMLIFTLIFGYVFNARYNVIAYETSTDFALGIFLSLIVYQLIGDSLAKSPNIILSNPNFVKKIVFPLEILAASSVMAMVVNFMFGLTIVIAGALIFGHGLSLYALIFPIIIFPVILMSLGIAWSLSALGVYIRDISAFVQILNMALMYLSAIFYSVDNLPHRLRFFLKLNPLVHAVEESRNVLLWNMPPEWMGIFYLYLVGIILFIAGYACFIALRPGFADVL